jgi:flagellar biosynthesis anti-sigma factor FlgM
VKGEHSVKIDPQIGYLDNQSSGRVAPADSAANSKPSKVSSESASSASDQASLSSDAVQFSGLRSKLNAVPEIRQDRVASISAAISNGTYSVSNKNIAQAVLRDFPSSEFGK